jgi:hypothetical protein
MKFSCIQTLITCAGRRYLRFFKFIDAFRLSARSAGLRWGIDPEVAASTNKTSLDTSAGLMATLEATKWSCLGMYLLLESLTLVSSLSTLVSVLRATSWFKLLFATDFSH